MKYKSIIPGKGDDALGICALSGLNRRMLKLDDLKCFLSMLSDPIVIIDLNSTIVYCNQPFCVLFGYPKKDIVFEKLDFLLNTPHSALKHRAYLAGYIKSDLVLMHHEDFSTLQPTSVEDSAVMSLLSILKMSEYMSACFRKNMRDDSTFEWDFIAKDVLNFLGLSVNDFNALKVDTIEQLQNGKL